MERELATLDESTLNSSSADDLKKLFLNQTESQPTEPEKPAEEPKPIETKEEPAKVAEEQPQEQQEKASSEPVEPVRNNNEDISYLKQQNQELLSIIRNLNTNSNVPKTEKKQLTPEEKLEAFTNDPDGYVQRKIEEALKPDKEKLRKIEEDQVFSIARNVSQDFKRLEPVIKNLMAKNPDYISRNVDPMKRLEGYYLLAEGLETKYLREKNLEKEQKKKTEQEKAKKVASSLPEPIRKTEQKSDKSIDKMSSKEIAEMIAKLK